MIVICNIIFKLYTDNLYLLINNYNALIKTYIFIKYCKLLQQK